MTTQARNAFNNLNRFLAEKNAELKKLQDDQKLLREKSADEAQLNIIKNKIEATSTTIKTFEGKKEDLLKKFPELNKPETVLDKISSLFSKKPVIASVSASPVKNQDTKEELNEDLNNQSPRNSATNIHSQNDDVVSENTSLLSRKFS